MTIPLAPRTARAIDLAVGERTDGPVFLAVDYDDGAGPGLIPGAQGDGQLTALASAMEGFTTRCHIFPACG